MAIRKIISGGQTGADRAALDWAIENQIPHGGFCPMGRLAEDGPIPTSYALLETKTDKYPERTKLNVETSDATLVIVGDSKLTGGSKLTVTHAEKRQKPVLVVFAAGAEQPTDLQIDEVRTWLEDREPLALNVAGSRASTSPNVHAFTKALLGAVIS
ncbi:putative molybdenum carrier protein [Luteolibacter sp. GHJ8]|uniref:Molybdenum carrier protein n=1 Tax=Luteolibacter rhizosphaerae TaxID=2989719 RepID=A0ABT3FZR7_9BACT|nr:putative molybdenum carrier protein [Luteolibacter rhizosphaerae]MCW1913076.1 putative molybdenum carrier protein [Luteolibacter rhizosphaerae]